MRHGFLGALAVVLSAAGMAAAQVSPPASPAPTDRPAPQLPPPPVAEGSADAPPAPYPAHGPWDDAPPHEAPPAGGASCATPCTAPTPCCWITAEYLLWRVPSGPLPVPLVSRQAQACQPCDEDGQPRTLFGGNPLDYPDLSGGRLTVGTWCSEYGTIGFEASGFALQQGSVRASFAESRDDVTLGLPFFNTALNKEDLFPVTEPGQTVGSINVSSTTQLWGAEANALFGLYRDCHNTFTLSGGFRYLDLREDIDIDTVTAPRLLAQVAFGGCYYGPPATTTTADQFATANHFYGGQVGCRWDCRLGGLFASAQGSLALGDTLQVLEVAGSSTLTSGPAPQRTLAGGIFALPSNSGRFTQDDFTVVPEAELKVGYQLTRHLSVFAGYDVLFWSRVIRPGDQIDRNLSPAQVPTSAFFGKPADISQPAPLFNPTDFWAQGVNIGLEVRY